METTSQNDEEKQKGIEAWSAHYGEPISEEDYEEICYNLGGFFRLLQEWADAENLRKKTE